VLDRQKRGAGFQSDFLQDPSKVPLSRSKVTKEIARTLGPPPEGVGLLTLDTDALEVCPSRRFDRYSRNPERAIARRRGILIESEGVPPLSSFELTMCVVL
jgi:hypothetical protein